MWNVSALNLSVSRRYTNFPSRKRTAPKYPTLCRVGWWSKTGSTVSGGTHIRQRDPCCWKCTSSLAHKSIPPLFTSARSFFICLLCFGISVRNYRTRLAQSKPELPEHALTLPHTQCDVVPLLNKCSQCLAIPQVRGQTQISRRLSNGNADLFQLVVIQPSRPSRPSSFDQTSQTSLLESVNPILYRSWRITKEPRDLRTGHTLCYKKDTVKTVVVPRFC